MSKKISKEMLNTLFEGIMDGLSLDSIINAQEAWPSKRTFQRHIQKHDEAYEGYSKAKAIQGENIPHLVEELLAKPLPDDAKLANAHVNLTRLKVESLWKRQSQLQSRGSMRHKVEDKTAVSGTITLNWEG